MNNIGSKIKFFRKRAGLSQMELELEIGASAGTLSRIESGAVRPLKETISKIVKALKLNTLEANYLDGPYSEPATDNEVDLIRSNTKEYMDKKGVFAYIVDERHRLLITSKSFEKITGFSSEDVRKVLGHTILEVILDKSLKVNSLLSKVDFTEFLRYQIKFFMTEMGFMIGDEYYQRSINIIKTNPIASRILKNIDELERVFSKPYEKYAEFNLSGIKVRMKYTVTPLEFNPRFRIVEYQPTNLVLRLLSKIW